MIHFFFSNTFFGEYRSTESKASVEHCSFIQSISIYWVHAMVPSTLLDIKDTRGKIFQWDDNHKADNFNLSYLLPCPLTSAS